ncbi:MAG TPA: hypothetical protein VJP89_01810 [Pyrinomonadaceae bacterium]|nr:hypothetical protein [Pyrinomonadaceae bacterium]
MKSLRDGAKSRVSTPNIAPDAKYRVASWAESRDLAQTDSARLLL